MTDKPDLTRVWAEGAPSGNVVDPDITTPGKFANGWQAEVPPFEHFNFIQKLQTQGLAHINEQGIPVWDADTVYPINALVKGSDGTVYKALSSQSGNDPVSSPSFWAFGSDLIAHTGTTDTVTEALDKRTLYVGSVAELEATEGQSDSQQADVLTESGWIHVYWDAASTATADGVDVFQVGGVTTGRWIRSTENVKNSLGNLENLQMTTDRLLDAGVTGADLMSKMMASVDIGGMYFRSRGTTGCTVGINMSDQLGMVAEYNFDYDGDNLLLLRGIYIGEGNFDRTLIEPTLNGTFNTNSAPSTYTTNPGDSFSFSFTGSYLRFKRRVENRGGLWRFFVLKADTGEVIKRVDVSCYSVSLDIDAEVDVVDGLPFDTYDVEAVFQGADPDFAPSSTPARGYLYYEAETASQPINYSKSLTIGDTSKDILSRNTVSDFAIRAKPAVATYGTEWVPNHGSVVGVADVIGIKVFADDIPVIETVGGASFVEFKEIDTFQITQRLNALNPNGADGAMWEHHIVHSMNSSDYQLKISQRVTLLQDTYVNIGYWAMLGAESSPAGVDRMVLNNGFVKEPVPVDGSNDSFGFDANQAAFLGAYEAGNGYGVCLNTGSLKEAVSLGTEYQPEVPLGISYRDDGIAKVYWKFFEAGELPAGLTLSHEGKFGVVCGARYPNVNLKSVG